MARPDPDAKYTIQQYLDLTNSNGEKIVAGGFEKYRLYNLFNNEFLGAATATPTDWLEGARTAIYTLSGLGYVEEYKDDFTQIQVSIVDRITIHLKNDFQKELKINKFDRKTVTEWNEYLNTILRNFDIAKNDQTNLINIDSIYKTCLATGNYIIMPELADPETLTPENIDKLLIRFTDKVNDLIIKRAIYNLDSDIESMRFVLSKKAGLSFIRHKSYINASDKAYQDISQKSTATQEFLGSIYGVPFYTSAYLGVNVPKSTSQTNNLKDYSFDKLIGMVTTPKTTICLRQELMLETFQDPTSKSHQLIFNAWSCNSTVFPQYAHLNFVILKDKPTLDEVKKARTEIYTQFPDLYPSFAPTQAPIDQNKLNEINRNNWKGLTNFTT